MGGEEGKGWGRRMVGWGETEVLGVWESGVLQGGREGIGEGIGEGEEGRGTAM